MKYKLVFPFEELSSNYPCDIFSDYDSQEIFCIVKTIIQKKMSQHYDHWRHCNPGHRAMGRVVFLPRPEIIYINTPFSLPRPEVIYIWAWLISAPNGVSAYILYLEKTYLVMSQYSQVNRLHSTYNSQSELANHSTSSNELMHI